jgi:hypothetical protein
MAKNGTVVSDLYFVESQPPEGSTQLEITDIRWFKRALAG